MVQETNPLNSLELKTQVECSLNALVELRKGAQKRRVLIDNGESIFLQVVIFKVPELDEIVRRRISLKYPVWGGVPDVCLIVRDFVIRDRVKRTSDEMIDITVEKYQDLLEKHRVTGITNVMPYHQLKTEYDTYELRRKLINRFDIFLCDSYLHSREHFFECLGKIFIEKNKFPIAVKLPKLKSDYDPMVSLRIKSAIASTVFYIKPSSDNYSIRIGNTLNEKEEIIENLNIVIDKILHSDNLIPGGIKNIRSLHIKTEKSKAVPIYMSLSSGNDIPVPLVKPNAPRIETVEGEISTLPGKKVTVLPSGDVLVTRIKRRTYAGEEGYEDWYDDDENHEEDEETEEEEENEVEEIKMEKEEEEEEEREKEKEIEKEKEKEKENEEKQKQKQKQVQMQKKKKLQMQKLKEKQKQVQMQKKKQLQMQKMKEKQKQVQMQKKKKLQMQKLKEKQKQMQIQKKKQLQMQKLKEKQKQIQMQKKKQLQMQKMKEKQKQIQMQKKKQLQMQKMKEKQKQMQKQKQLQLQMQKQKQLQLQKQKQKQLQLQKQKQKQKEKEKKEKAQKEEVKGVRKRGQKRQRSETRETVQRGGKRRKVEKVQEYKSKMRTCKIPRKKTDKVLMEKETPKKKKRLTNKSKDDRDVEAGIKFAEKKYLKNLRRRESSESKRETIKKKAPKRKLKEDVKPAKPAKPAKRAKKAKVVKTTVKPKSLKKNKNIKKTKKVK